MCFISTAGCASLDRRSLVRAVGRRERRHLPKSRGAVRNDPDVHRRPAKNVIAGRACARSCTTADGTSVRGRRSVYHHGKLVVIAAAARTPGQSDRQRTKLRGTTDGGVAVRRGCGRVAARGYERRVLGGVVGEVVARGVTVQNLITTPSRAGCARRTGRTSNTVRASRASRNGLPPR